MSNVYDNLVFFRKYLEYRKNPNCLNNATEQEIVRSIIPNLVGKTILDVGSGFGEFCKYASCKGANLVIGIDSSKMMYQYAKKNNSGDNIRYINSSFEKFINPTHYFDIVVSSLVFHYINDLNAQLLKIYGLLKPGGIFAFSVNHPSFSSTFIKRKVKEASNTNLTEGLREHNWLNHPVLKYHRTLNTYYNSLKETGFVVKKTVEINTEGQKTMFIVFLTEKL